MQRDRSKYLMVMLLLEAVPEAWEQSQVDDIYNLVLTYTHTHTEPTKKQFTVLVIKPDAVQAGKVDEILEKVSFTPTHTPHIPPPHTHAHTSYSSVEPLFIVYGLRVYSRHSGTIGILHIHVYLCILH